MCINELLETKIEEIVTQRVKESLSQLQEDFKEHLETTSNVFPNTRYLSPSQVCEYIGKKSKTGLKELLAERGILPIQLNQRVVRYDRQEIDSKLTMQDCMEQYLKAWK